MGLQVCGRFGRISSNPFGSYVSRPTSNSHTKTVRREDFDKATKDALTLPPVTTDESKLILYGLFKQATVGNVNTSRPGMFDLKGKAKWDAWKKVEGKTKEDAMQDYITKVTQLLEEA